MSILKPITTKSISNEVVAFSGTGYVTISTTNLKFTSVQRSPTNGREFSNMFVSLNLPTSLQQIINYTVNPTTTSYSLSALNVSNIIIAEIPQNTYGELIDGRTINLNIPMWSGSPQQQVTLNCRSSYFTPYNVSSDYSEQGAVFGQPLPLTQSPYQGPSSNIAFIVSDQIQAPPYGRSWTTGYDTSNPPAGFPDPNGNATTTFSFTSSSTPKVAIDQTRDTLVGIAYLDKGFIALTHPAVVAGFIYSAGTTNGTTRYSGASSGFTALYFTGSPTADCSYYSFEQNFVLEALCIAGPNEFKYTENATAEDIGAAKVPGVDIWDLSSAGKASYITEVGLFDGAGNLVAIAKPDRPIAKAAGTSTYVTLKFRF